MTIRSSNRAAIGAALVVACALLPAVAHAVDGVIEINHARALAGGVTPSDTAGYPVTLDASGSYRLTGSLRPPAGTSGIVISANYVTIDLNGFSIEGTATCTGVPVSSCTEHGGIGIDGFTSTGTSVRNGIVRGMDAGLMLGDSSVIEGVAAVANAGAGINLGSYSRVEGARVGGNGDAGMLARSDSKVLRSEAHGNGGAGITTGERCIVSENNVYRNGLGISQFRPGMADRNVVSANGAEGIAISYPAVGQGPVRASGNMLIGNGTDLGAGVTSTGTNSCTSGPC